MLKITYTENDFYLEYFKESLETWIAKRILLCLRAGASIYVEPSVASFVIPGNLPYLNDLETLKAENDDIVKFTPCDDEWLDIELQGTWVSSQEDGVEGVFVCAMQESTEFFLYKLWQESRTVASAIGE
jgi:hypothetical protein